MGIIDDYFDGYYSEEMIESQVMLATILFSQLSILYSVLVLFSLKKMRGMMRLRSVSGCQ